MPRGETGGRDKAQVICSLKRTCMLHKTEVIKTEPETETINKPGMLVRHRVVYAETHEHVQPCHETHKSGNATAEL